MAVCSNCTHSSEHLFSSSGESEEISSRKAA